MKCLAPMVEGSEYPFRELVSHFGITHYWTPMYNVQMLQDDDLYLQKIIRTIQFETRKVIVQLAGNIPGHFKIIISQLKHLQNIEYFDLNLGCAQVCAQRGNYGSYLMEEKDLVRQIIQVFHDEGVNVSVKTRIFSDKQKTSDFVQFLIDNDVTLITLHGRLSKLKMGCFTGDADIEGTLQIMLKFMSTCPNVKFVYNGGIYKYQQVQYINKLNIGVMSAQLILQNPMFMIEEQNSEFLEEQWLQEFESVQIVDNLIHLIDIQFEKFTEFDNDDVFISVSNDKQNKIIKQCHTPKLFGTIEQRIMRIKACFAFCSICEQALCKDLEVSISCILSISMSLFGRDFLKYQIDLRDQIVKKDTEKLSDDVRIQTRCKLIKSICKEAVRRLQQNKGLITISKLDIK